MIGAKKMSPESAKFDPEAEPCACDRLPLLVANTSGDYRLECNPCGARTHAFPTAERARSQWAAMIDVVRR